MITNTGCYYIEINDLKRFNEEVKSLIAYQLKKLGKIDSMDKFEVTVDGHTQLFEVYTQYTLDDLMNKDYSESNTKLDSFEEDEIDVFIPFIIYLAKDNYTDFVPYIFVKDISEFEVFKNA
jgi:hypothetical protein